MDRPESSRDLTIFIISSISSFDIISVVPDPRIFLWIPESVAAAAAVKPNGNNMLLASGVVIFIINPANLLNKAPRKPD